MIELICKIKPTSSQIVVGQKFLDFLFLIKINVKHVERSCHELNKECDEFLIQLSRFLSELSQVETLKLTQRGHTLHHTSLEQSPYKCIVTAAQVAGVCPRNSSAHSINPVSGVMSCYHSRCFLFNIKIFDDI